jgi:hypothetical protein
MALIRRAGFALPYEPPPKALREYSVVDQRPEAVKARKAAEANRVKSHWERTVFGSCPSCKGAGTLIRRKRRHNRVNVFPRPMKPPPKFGDHYLYPPGASCSWGTVEGLIYGIIAVPCPVCRPDDYRQWVRENAASVTVGERKRAPTAGARAAEALALIMEKSGSEAQTEQGGAEGGL